MILSIERNWNVSITVRIANILMIIALFQCMYRIFFTFHSAKKDRLFRPIFYLLLSSNIGAKYMSSPFFLVSAASSNLSNSPRFITFRLNVIWARYFCLEAMNEEPFIPVLLFEFSFLPGSICLMLVPSTIRFFKHFSTSNLIFFLQTTAREGISGL